MSNIHTLNSINQGSNANNRSDQYIVKMDSSDQSAQNRASRSNTGNYSSSQPQPQEQSKFRTCLDMFFPKFSIKSFTFVITIIQILIFIITVGVNARIKYDGSFTCVLYKFGAKFTPAITVYDHYHRLIIPIFLHGGFAHIIFNMLTQLRYGFFLESHYGIIKFVVLYILSGIGGNLMSAVAKKQSISIGASSSLYGVLALQLAWMITNYRSLGPKKNFYIGTFAILIIIDLATIGEAKAIDGFAHLGGFIVGSMISFLYITLPSLKFKIAKVLVAILIVVYFVATIAAIATFKGLENDALGISALCDAVYKMT